MMDGLLFIATACGVTPQAQNTGISPALMVTGSPKANSTLVAYEHLGDPSYSNAAYRSTMPVFLCYDWNVQSTNKRLQKGEAASTYCVANANYNFEELSRNRFGQSIFVNYEDELFQSLFQNALGDDWDMGES